MTVGQASATGTSSVPLAANAAVPTAASAAAPEATGADSGDDDTCEEDGSDETSPADGEDDDTCEDEPEETVTATVIPVPTGSNGTGSAYPTGAALKNRFAKMY